MIFEDDSIDSGVLTIRKIQDAMDRALDRQIIEDKYIITKTGAIRHGTTQYRYGDNFVTEIFKGEV